jgi:hypothetical protein
VAAAPLVAWQGLLLLESECCPKKTITYVSAIAGLNPYYPQ